MTNNQQNISLYTVNIHVYFTIKFCHFLMDYVLYIFVFHTLIYRIKWKLIQRVVFNTLNTVVRICFFITQNFLRYKGMNVILFVLLLIHHEVEN